MKSPIQNPVAYSYVRFSQASQARGHSVERQTELAEWGAKQLGVPLDPSTFSDLGVSAYTGEHRNNPDRHGLALFLQAVEQKKVKPGDYLLVENLDRLSREHVMVALGLLLNLVNSGVRVVQLAPALVVFDQKSEPMHLMMAIMELSRGNSESAMKADRCGKAWRKKKELARTDGTPTTKMLPAWIELVDGKLSINPTAGAAVHRIYELSVSGFGHVTICKTLTKEGHKPIGKSGVWVRSYVAHLLRCRQVLGEYQPIIKKTGEADGEPIKDYYPAVVSNKLYYQAQHAKSLRDGTTGRKLGQTNFNYFQGLLCRLEDPTDKYFTHTLQDYKKRRSPYVVYGSTKAQQGTAKSSTFPQRIFDMCFFDYFKKLTPKDVLGVDTTSDELSAVSGELAEVKTKIEALTLELETGGEMASLVKVLRKWEKKAEDLTKQQTDLRQKASHPKAEAFGESQHLVGSILWDNRDKDADEMKHRLRACLRRVIDLIYCSFWGTRHRRYAVAQITFKDSKAIQVLMIDYSPARATGGGGKKTVSKLAEWTADSKIRYRLLTPDELEALFPLT